MLIDFHTHLFPDALAPRTLPMLAATANAPYYTDGTVAGTLTAAADWGVDYNVVLHIATRPGQQRTINDFAKRVQDDHPNFLCFGTVHPKDPQALPELARIRALGLYGVKLHLAYQECFAGDEAYFPLYEEMERLGLPVLFHAGIDPVSPVNYAPAEALAAVARAFPRLTVIAAHMGALMEPREGAKLCGYDNVYFDTAMSSIHLDPGDYAALLRKRGPEHVLFGTDCPWNTVAAELGRLETLGLSADELEDVKWRNAARILGLKL